MNLLYMKYAVEIADEGSLNKAAGKLYIDQPNLSRALKELESSLGVTLFERSAKGMKPTPDGEKFVEYARTILGQVDAVENMFRHGTADKLRFSVSVPRASYIAEAFAAFAAGIDEKEQMEFFYKETNSMRTIKNVMQADYKLGIVRYAENYDKYYKELLAEKGLESELVTEFRYVLVMRADAPLAAKEEVTFADLEGLTEIAHADPYVPSLPFSEVKKEELPDARRRICVFERGSQFDLLSTDPHTYMWVSPIPRRQLECHGLVQRACADNRKVYKDVMIYRKDHKLTEWEKRFISELCKVKREVFREVAQ